MIFELSLWQEYELSLDFKKLLLFLLFFARNLVSWFTNERNQVIIFIFQITQFFNFLSILIFTNTGARIFLSFVIFNYFAFAISLGFTKRVFFGKFCIFGLSVFIFSNFERISDCSFSEKPVPTFSICFNWLL